MGIMITLAAVAAIVTVQALPLSPHPEGEGERGKACILQNARQICFKRHSPPPVAGENAGNMRRMFWLSADLRGVPELLPAVKNFSGFLKNSC